MHPEFRKRKYSIFSDVGHVWCVKVFSSPFLLTRLICFSKVDFFHSVWSSSPLKITIIWLFFGSVFLLSLKGMRCASRLIFEIRDCWSPRKPGTERSEEKELEQSPGCETPQISNKPRGRGWPVYFLSVITRLLRLLSCCAQTQVEG